MKKFLILIAAATLSIAAVSCQKHETGETGRIPENILKSFSKMYPEASDVNWATKGQYAVANFTLPQTMGGSNNAWYEKSNGNWDMTEMDIRYEDLPEAVRNAFESSEYGQWRVDDVDMIERHGVDIIYVIEAEGTQDGRPVEIDLYYSPDGILVKKVIDADENYDYEDFIIPEPAGSIEEFINQNYPEARIIDIDIEHGYTEVEIIDGRTVRELLFGENATWIYTKTEMRRSDVPQEIMGIFESSEYSAYRIDDIDHYVTAEKGEFYRFELETPEDDFEIDIFADGTITVADKNWGNPGGTEPGDGGQGGNIEKFIEENYPGARIIEKDYDDGYIEVEIFHDGREKNIYFNGGEEWVWSEWDVRLQELPQAVSDAVSAQYPDYRIDDCEYMESPQGEWYRIEIERGDREIELRISPDGTIL